MKDKSVLIFGGSGFIGSHLSRYLLESKLVENVFCADIVEPRYNFPQQKYIYCDVRSPIDIDVGKGDIETIYNFAAVHRTPGHTDKEYFETNILGAENICNFAKKREIDTIIFTSSISVYGPSEELKTEETLPQPITPYGSSKIIAEYIHRLWLAENPNRKLIILRPGTVFGEEENGNFARLFRSISKGYFFYPGRRDTKKACIYIKDLIQLMLEMINSKKHFQIYNMCYPEAPSIENIVKAMSYEIDISGFNLTIPSIILETVALVLKGFSKLTKKELGGIHPERVRKLMVSTNISGEKLVRNSLEIKYSLRESFRDWYKDCDYKGLL